jgi:hypothetical protein
MSSEHLQLSQKYLFAIFFKKSSITVHAKLLSLEMRAF